MERRVAVGVGVTAVDATLQQHLCVLHKARLAGDVQRGEPRFVGRADVEPCKLDHNREGLACGLGCGPVDDSSA